MVSDSTEWQYWGTCENVKNKLDDKKELCNIGVDNKENSFILWGDSHARALVSSVNQSAKKYDLAGQIATQAGCPPLLHIERPNRLSCHEFNQTVLQYISDRPNIKTVILVARWALSTNSTRYKKESGTTIKLVDLQSNSNNDTTNTILFEIGLRRTIDSLQKLGREVVLVNPIPEVGYDVPSANFISLLSGREVNSIISPSLNEYYQRIQSVVSIFTSLEKEKNIKIIDPSKYLCDKEYCKVVVNDVPLYRDDDHLSTYGSKYVSRSFDPVFINMLIN